MGILTGRIASIAFSVDGKLLISLEVNEGQEALKTAQKLKDSPTISIKLSAYKKKRSLDANAYFHLLVNKIAAKIRSSDEEVKRNMVLNYGVIARDDDGMIFGAMIPAGKSIAPFYPYAKCYKTDFVGGKEVDCYLFYKRTRDMTTTEFSRLLEGTVHEAKNLGIETMTPEELERIKDL